MLLVALTGGIASGKTVVANVLKELGCYIHHADKIAHQLMKPEEQVWEAIVARFGKNILNQDKTINRTKLGAIVYSDEKARFFLNKLVHPLVFENIKEIIQKLIKENQYKIFISEAALTIEAGFADFFDKIILVYCHNNIQIKRLMERDNISKNEALKKIKSQLSPENKLEYTDYLIDTCGSIRSTVEQTEQVYRNLIMDYELKKNS